ncbi:jg4878 [Pararge aegeria aegeria]|uniref:Jg4878 protein n=1 Tax=Pararge aegeria aegeria TaxID=348720 RepID=A0A8S4QHF4_9NEOP|nr:jg4878 [Pararge aegeria aegeria]
MDRLERSLGSQLKQTDRHSTIHAPRITILDRGSRDRRSILDRLVGTRLMFTRADGARSHHLAALLADLERNHADYMRGFQNAPNPLDQTSSLISSQASPRDPRLARPVITAAPAPSGQSMHVKETPTQQLTFDSTSPASSEVDDGFTTVSHKKRKLKPSKSKGNPAKKVTFDPVPTLVPIKRARNPDANF